MSVAIKILDSILGNFTDAKAKYERLRQELSKTDMTISDILHALELGSFSACEGYKYAKLLKVTCQDRRYYKNELEQMGILIKDLNNLDLEVLRQKLIKLENHQISRKYTPRVLPENQKESLLRIV